MVKKSLKQRATQKKRSDNGYWHGKQNNRITPERASELKRAGFDLSGYDISFEGQQYRGGRAPKTKNLVKLNNGNLQNQHGVIFSPDDKKLLEREANKANAKRKRMLEEEANLPRYIGGKETGQTVGQLQIMGKESDFIISRKSKSLQGFKSRDDFENYIDNLKRVNSKGYIDERTELYKQNHLTALDNAFGDEAKDIKAKLQELKPKEYRRLLQSEEAMEISYIYDPSARTAKLNQMRSALKINESE